jgi:branched-chain amino acid transport system permease protein
MLGIACVALAGLLLSLFLQSEFQLNLLVLVMLWMVVGISWNMISGYTALISFGHAVFFGLGAFSIVLLQIKWGISPWLGLPIAALTGALAGGLIGVITLRLSGVYFALAMLCYPMVLVYLFDYAGFQEVTVPMHREAPLWFMQFASQRGFAYLALGLLVLALLISAAVERSRFGLWLRSIKQNEAAASALGINCFRWKLSALVLSGALGAAAGAIYAEAVLVITPASVFGVAVSAQALVVALFGGVGTLWGPVIGAGLLIPLGELLKQEFGAVLPGINGVILGVIVIATVLFAPQGVFWRLRQLLNKADARDSYSVAGEKPLPRLADDGMALTRASGRPAENASAVLLSVRGLGRAIGGVRAVNDASFDVFQGEILGVIGPNGAGKTTLMNLIGGFIKPDEGSVKLEGVELVGKPSYRIASEGLGRTFQVARVFPQMTLFGNVAVGAVTGHAGLEWQRATWNAVDLVGLRDRANVIAHSATARDLRLMELARAAARAPKLLLVDECLAGLSTPEVEEMVVALQRLRRSGTTIVIIEHTMQAMVRLADRFLVLDHGTVIASGHPATVMLDPLVLQAYLGRRFAKALSDEAAASNGVNAVEGVETC